MAAPIVQILPVPDVGAGDGPWASPAWIAGSLATITRLGLATNATNADRVALLGSAVGPGGGAVAADPIDLSNPNLIASFTGPGMLPRELLKFASSCPYYAIVRLPPANGEAPTSGLSLEMIS
jgi:hypothetical protein